MEKLTLPDFNTLTEKNKILECDGHGPKVLKTDDNKIIKIFRLKRRFSSASFLPYAVRFKRNAEQLSKLDIETVKVEKIAYCPENLRHIIVYPMISGLSLREKLETHYSPELIQQLAVYIAHLHDLGIFFRSLHMGNIIVTHDRSFALIDISDMRIYKKSLSIKKRIRNFMHFFRYQEDKKFLSTYGIDEFFSIYIECCEISAAKSQKLQNKILNAHQLN